MRILLTKLKLIGDALLITPTVHAIRERYPEAEIVVVVRKGTEGILAGCSAIDRLLTATAPEDKRRSRWNWLEDLWLIAELRRKPFDYAFELSDGDRGRWICALARAKVRSTNAGVLPLNFFWRRVFTSVSTFDWIQMHRVEKDFRTVAHDLDLSGTPPPLCFERARAEATPVSAKGGEHCVVFNPGSRLPEKLWPEDRWIAVGRELAARGDLIVVSTGPAEDEIALGRRLAEGIGPRALSTSGALTWPQLAHLFYNARLLVTVDTAAMHLAAACQCPTVALFGLVPAGQWRPWRAPNRVLTALGEWGEVTAEAARRDRPIDRITVDDVLAAVGELAAETRSGVGAVHEITRPDCSKSSL
jgi:heptosyltransferase-3